MISELKTKKSELVAKADEIISQADYKKAEFDAVMAEIERVDAQIKDTEKLSSVKDDMRANESKNYMSESKTMNTEIKVGKDLAADRPFASYAEYLVKVIRAQRGLGEKDPRLVKAAYTNTSGSVAGLFNIDIQPDQHLISQPSGFYGVFKMYGAVKPTARGHVQINKVTGVSAGATAQGAKKAEAAAGSIGAYTYTHADLKLESYYTFMEYSDELAEDEPAFLAQVKAVAIDEMQYKLSNVIAWGGGSTEGLGFLNGSTGGSYIAVAKDTNQTAATITKGNVLAMYKSVLRRGGDRLVWFVSSDAFVQLFSLETVAGNAVIFVPSYGTSADGRLGTLMGLPVFESANLKAAGTVGDIVLVNIDGIAAYEPVSGGIKEAKSEHIKFLEGDTVARFSSRFACAPLISTALSINSISKAYAATVAVRS